MSDTLAQFRRFDSLIREMMVVAPFGAETERADTVQIERGIVFARAVMEPDNEMQEVTRLIELARSGRIAHVAVVDRNGHRRPAYRAMLGYSWLQAYRLLYERLDPGAFGQWEEALRGWCDLLESDLGQIDWPSDRLPGAWGNSATQAAWTALALHVAGSVFIRDAWTDLAADAFGKLVSRQTESGTFLNAEADDNPEGIWYDELVILHAATSFAVQSEDRSVASAVARATAFHFENTQPDHSTNQPFGLFAFIWNPKTHSLADQMLHAARAHAGDQPGGIALMLLADALYSLKLFL